MRGPEPRLLAVTAAAVLLLIVARPVDAAEICGNGVDDDANGLADEGCMPSATTGVCESPLDCGLNGAVGPKSGTLTYDLAADLAPAVPYGPGLSMQRFYTSAYDPGSGAPAYRKPLGERWQHGYMSWLDKITSSGSTTVVLHTPRGRDVLFTYASTSGGYAYYTPQVGFHVVHLRQATSSPYKWELKSLEGAVDVYDFNTTTNVGKLIEIRDSLATPNVLSIGYDGNGQVDTVADASGVRRLVFGYTSGALTSVAYQTVASGTPTTRAAATYAYTSGQLTSASISGKLVHTYSYTSGLLTKIEDSDGNDLATFAYTASGGKVARVETGEGAVGYEYASGRSSCSGKTVLYFNAPTSIACDDDSDCASVSTDLMCGGETDPSSANTGRCYYAGRCLTVTSPSEDLVTTVTPVAPAGGTCDGACTDVAEYSWTSSDPTVKGTKDPGNNWISYQYDANGMPTTIVTGDSDDDATNSGGLKTWLFYGDSAFPGRVTEVRRGSAGGGSCSATDTSSCKRTRMTYNADGLLASVEETGYTLSAINSWFTYDYVTSYSYDGQGRLTQVDGPLTGSDDVTEYAYWSSSDVLKNGFLEKFKRKKDASTYVTVESLTYDHWGNVTSSAAADGTLTCFAYDADQGWRTEKRETMAGQTSCTSNAADLVTTWTRDTIGRLRSTQTPDGSCVYQTYDGLGRLATVKRRDDCNPSSAGDTTTYTYGDGDRVTKVEVTDASSTVTRRREVAYYESRRVKSYKDPASSQSATLTYDDRGLVTQVDAPSGLGKTGHTFDAMRRETERRNYTTSTDYDAWTLAYYYLFYSRPYTVADEDAKTVTETYDDMDRRVRRNAPDGGNTLWAYDAAGRITERNEAYGSGASELHAFSFDHLDRPLTEDYLSSCGAGATPEVEYTYDAPPVTCPSGAGCLRTGGRLAYVKTSLFCSTSLTDKSFDQETFYSYDDAGRLIGEYIRDDGGRVATQTHTWSKTGALESTTTPSGVTLGATFGGPGNSDNALPATLWRGTSSSPVIEDVTWFPFGGLRSYRHQNTIRGHQLQTVISRDLAGRVTDVLVEDSVDGTDQFDVAITRDDKGRVTQRDYTGGATGLQDSVFTYDWLDRILCEATSTGSSCPTSGSTLKNNISGSPPYTAGSDRREFRHAIAGYSSTLHQISLVSGAHRINYIDQPGAYGQTGFGWNVKGDRVWETNYGYDVRGYGYDERRNLNSVNGFFKPTSGSAWHNYYLSATFDQRNRRVGKGLYDATTGQFSYWYFYYDPMDRLVEIKYWPDSATSSTYSLFQISWLGERPIAMFQTDYPGTTLSRRYVHMDDSGRPMEMYSWPASGDAGRVWAINSDEWANDSVLVGSSVFQPLVVGHLYRDIETASWFTFGQEQRPPLLNAQYGGMYDPFVGAGARAYHRERGLASPYHDGSIHGTGPVEGEVSALIVAECNWYPGPSGPGYEHGGTISLDGGEGHVVCDYQQSENDGHHPDPGGNLPEDPGEGPGGGGGGGDGDGTEDHEPPPTECEVRQQQIDRVCGLAQWACQRHFEVTPHELEHRLSWKRRFSAYQLDAQDTGFGNVGPHTCSNLNSYCKYLKRQWENHDCDLEEP